MDEELHDNPFPEDADDELARLAQETIESQVGMADSLSARTRCERVIALHRGGFVRDARDNFHAALVLLYGEKTSHYELARLFAYRSATMGESRAWCLQAMAWDRWLISMGKPQRFGTQIIKKDGRWSLGALDERVTDNDRALYAVPPLVFQQHRADKLHNQEDHDT